MQSPAFALASVLFSVAVLTAAGCTVASDEPAASAFAHDAAEPRWQPAPTAGAGGDDGAGSAGEPSTSADQVCPDGRTILSEDVVNARDLGGVALGDGRHVACGAIFRGSPLRLSTAGCQELQRLGIASVIDLRIDSERASVPDVDCGATASVLAPLPIPFGLSAEDYLRDLHEAPSLAAAFRAFGSKDAYPIYFHCTFGRDRTGVVAALVLLALGATRETVMQEYLLSKPFVGAYPDALNAVLDEIEARGGADAVLKDAGVTETQLATLRERAIGD